MHGTGEGRGGSGVVWAGGAVSDAVLFIRVERRDSAADVLQRDKDALRHGVDHERPTRRVRMPQEGHQWLLIQRLQHWPRRRLARKMWG